MVPLQHDWIYQLYIVEILKYKTDIAIQIINNKK